MKLSKLKNTILFKLIELTAIPIIVISIAFPIFGIKELTESHAEQTYATLEGICLQVRNEFSSKFPGDYSYDENGHFYSGSSNIYDEGMKIVETFKDNFNTEVSIFFGDTRALTTIANPDGQKIIGTLQSDTRVLDSVFNEKTFTANDVLIYDQEYHVAYIPLYDNDEVYGMVFAGIENSKIRKDSRDLAYQFIIIMAMVALATFGIVIIFSMDFADKINSIKEYIGSLTRHEIGISYMPDDVLLRKDEIGDLGRYAVDAGNRIKIIMGQDPLTHLLNRRTGVQYLNSLWESGLNMSAPFTVTMCDIDYFKSVNDTYGHDMGDTVLMAVAKIMDEHVKQTSDSFAIRWGGEEFLLGFSLSEEDTLTVIKSIQAEIKELTFRSENVNFGLTMTFGIAAHKDENSIEELISLADSRLYIGKEGGRDRIISSAVSPS